MSVELKKSVRAIGGLVLLVAAAYAAGYWASPTKTVATKMRDEEYTQQRIEQYKQQHRDEFTVVKHQVQTVVKPCPAAAVPDGTCKPPCATECSRCPSQVLSVTTDTEEHHDATTTTDGTVASTTTGTAHETDVTTKTRDAGSSGPWSLSLGASTRLYDGKTLTLTPKLKFDASLGRRLIGPVWVSVDCDTDKTATGSVDLHLGDWLLSVQGGSRYDRWSPFYGGSLNRKLAGPVWVGAKVTSDGAASVSLGLRAW